MNNIEATKFRVPSEGALLNFAALRRRPAHGKVEQIFVRLDARHDPFRKPDQHGQSNCRIFGIDR
jgi:hypothetical protein